MEHTDSFTHKLWEFLKSVKLTVVLLTLILISSTVGTLVIQKSQSDMDVNKVYSQGIIALFNFLDLFDLYHSWWFILLLFILCINLLVCTIDKFPVYLKIYKAKPKAPEVDKVKSSPLFKEYNVNSDEKFDGILKKFSSFEKLESIDDGTEIYVKSSGRLSTFNVFTVHTGILILMMGAMFGSIFGFSGRMVLSPNGTSNTVKIYKTDGRILTVPLPFAVKLNKFEIDYYDNDPNGRPKQYSSEVETSIKGDLTGTHTVAVNHPLEHMGVNLYQSSYQSIPILNFKMKDLKTKKEYQMTTGFKRKTQFKGSKISIVVVDFSPDFPMGEHKSLGPAAMVHILGKDIPKRPFWTFKNYPNFTKPVNDRYKLTLVNSTFEYNSILDVSKNPGIPIIWLGCTLLTVGFFLVALYKLERRFLIIDKKSKKAYVYIKSRKLPINAKISFDSFAQSVEEVIK